MTPVQTLLAARRHGASLSVGRDGKLHVRGGGSLPEDVKNALREHGQRLVQLLSLDARPHWRTYDGHDCWTGCARAEHPLCNACGQELPERLRFWPHLHPGLSYGAARLMAAAIKAGITDVLYDVEILGQTARSMAHTIAKIKPVLLYDCVTALDTTPGRGCFWSEREPTGLSVTLSDADFMELPYGDRAFDLGLNDAPHLAGLGKDSYFRSRYDTYSSRDQRRIITAGARETWRCSALATLIKVTDHVNSARYKRQSGWVIDAIGQEPYATVVVVHGEVGSNRWSGGDPNHEWQSARSVSSTLLIFRRGSQEHSAEARARRMAAMAARLRGLPME